MNKGFVACVLLGGCTSLACAQDSGSAAATGKRSGLDYVGEPPGGHDIAVFTGQPSRSSSGAWHAQPRRTYGRLDDIGVRPGTGGFTLGHQYNFEYLARPDVGDPFHAGTAGKASNLVTQSGMPVDSGVRYYNTQFKHLST
jgi:hypothetical protein